MNFKDWLSGYLEGKESLNKDEIELIKKKMAETIDFTPSYPYPIFYPAPQNPLPNIWYSNGTGDSIPVNTFTYC